MMARLSTKALLKRSRLIKNTKTITYVGAYKSPHIFEFKEV